jgi:hypothetical protein
MSIQNPNAHFYYLYQIHQKIHQKRNQPISINQFLLLLLQLLLWLLGSFSAVFKEHNSLHSFIQFSPAPAAVIDEQRNNWFLLLLITNIITCECVTLSLIHNSIWLNNDDDEDRGNKGINKNKFDKKNASE